MRDFQLKIKQVIAEGVETLEQERF